ncbi:MAG: hypothetical protein CFH01_01890 [Alphaproteobacteria bacterium MarineAlpha2_Bin1]|nr:MAG: hypothetical protein CFH01_01890 [Alphaproteobacteria bacterium MarineAlpha2_Bin1]|tara:strand:+ start:1104 stop:1610 length:507 start_codon:yes stop_codon:yes gene_type:complete
MKKLLSPNKITLKVILFFTVFKIISVSDAKDLNELDIEIINGIIATQKESITTLNEFKNFQKSKNKSIDLIQKILDYQISNIIKIRYLKTDDEDKESLIDYDIPMEDLDNQKKFTYFLIDLTETNIESYREAIISVKNTKLKEIIEKIIINETKTLETLYKLAKIESW